MFIITVIVLGAYPVFGPLLYSARAPYFLSCLVGRNFPPADVDGYVYICIYTYIVYWIKHVYIYMCVCIYVYVNMTANVHLYLGPHSLGSPSGVRVPEVF